MPQTINTNVVSLNAQRNLNSSQASLATAMQRLSSGLRVNSAKDDAAGLAIAERMNTQVRGLNVAARNANDGISMAQIAEGSLGKMGDMLQRMRELAVQAANATNSVTDRAALQAEVTQLREEIQRLALTTSFNGTKLFNGEFTSAVFQVGANAGEIINFENTVDARIDRLGSTSLFTANSGATPPTGTLPLAEIAAGTLTVADAAGNNIELGRIPPAATAAERLNQVVNAINGRSNETGVFARLNDTGNGIQVFAERELAAAAFVGFTAADTGPLPANLATGATPTEVFISDISVDSFAGSQIAFMVVDSAINAINSSRADLGALQSRFENAIANIEIAAENTAAARGRIMDADFAAETATLSRAQILQQAGTAMVAQANQLPQQVLQLLQR